MTDPFGDLPITDQYEVDAETLLQRDAAWEKDVEYARKSQTHLWTAIVSFRISDDMAAGMARGLKMSPQLDRENVVNIVVGCFMCEMELNPRLIGKRCKEVHPHG